MRSLTRIPLLALALAVVAAVVPDNARAVPRDDTASAQPIAEPATVVATDTLDSVAIVFNVETTTKNAIAVASEMPFVAIHRGLRPLSAATVHRQPMAGPLALITHPPNSGHMATSDRWRSLG